MKKSFLSIMLTAMAVSMAMSVNADNRIYYVHDNFIGTDPAYTYIAYSNIWMWQREYGDAGFTCTISPAADVSPVGGMYNIFTADENNDGWAGFGYVASNTAVDLSSVTEDWTLNFYLKTNIVDGEDNAISFTFAGANNTSASIAITKSMMPTAKRNFTDWQLISIPVYQLTDQNWAPGVIPAAENVIFFQCNFHNLTKGESKIAFDEMFFTDGVTDLKNVSASTTAGKKFIENGDIYFSRDNHVYTVLGQIVK
ncbi:MAG: hypothetical protein MJZ58_01035 [Paludibacteraceae bacterium]|nr:hypothetical protein [Paludibacteraceae bacterium]